MRIVVLDICRGRYDVVETFQMWSNFRCGEILDMEKLEMNCCETCFVAIYAISIWKTTI